MLRLIAQFPDTGKAEIACAGINALLDDAKAEVAELFETGGGIAELADVTAIYARFGLTNESGWEQDRALQLMRDQVVWDVPVGASLEEIQSILLSFGAQAMAVHTLQSDEPWHDSPHPMSFVVNEDGITLLAIGEEFDDDDFARPVETEKKVLH